MQTSEMMRNDYIIEKATIEDSYEVALMVGELLNEIMKTIGIEAFHFNISETIERLSDFINREKYFVFICRKNGGSAVGFVTLYESYALYAEGAFGTIPELYVKPEHRSMGLGQSLLSHAKSFALKRGWKRLEVTTPPLPEFDRALAFYEREGFLITGGRKLKISL